MKGLFTRARTVRSAKMWVISPGRWAICALRIVFKAYIRWVSFFRTCMTFPKLPFPITLSKSNASIVSGSPRTGRKSTFKWKDPEPADALYHWSEACCVRCYNHSWQQQRRRRTCPSSIGVRSTRPIRRSLPISSWPCTGAAVRR